MRLAHSSDLLRSVLCLMLTAAACDVVLSQSPAAGRAADPVPANKQEIRLRAVDAENRPLPGVTVLFSVMYQDESGKGRLKKDELPTDGSGELVIGLPGQSPSLRLWAWKAGYASVFANWEAAEIKERGQTIPKEFTLRLLPVVSAGGRIVDEEGQPIAGVQVEVELAEQKIDFLVDSPLRYVQQIAWGKNTLTTDAEGRWKVTNLPKFSSSDLKLKLVHPDFILPHAQDRTHRQISVKRDEAIRGEVLVRMKRGNVVTGQVTDAEGNPIEKALVIVGNDPGWDSVPSKFPTDADGRFRLPAMPTAHTTLTVIAPSFAPQMRKLMVSPDLPPQYFRLEKGEPVTVRVVDEKNQPIPNAVVHIENWNYSRSIATMQAVEHPPVPDTGIPQRTNAEGIWEWKSAPKGKLTLRIYAKGFDEVVREVGGETRAATVRLTPPHRITVKAVDAATGQPIPRFTTLLVVRYSQRDRLIAQRSSTVEGKDGRAEIIARSYSTADPLRVRVEAVGYQTQDGPDFQPGDDSPRTVEFRLRPSPPVSGIVQDPTGKPLPNARVVMATPSESGDLEYQPFHSELRAFTDAEGRFALPDPGAAWAIAVSHPEGHAYVRRRAGENDVGVLRLEPWAKVRGRFFDGGKPVAKTSIYVQPIEEEDPSLPELKRFMHVETDEAGRFEFDRVPPGLVKVQVYLGPWNDFGVRSGPCTPLDLKPG
ncbi:MAG: carboxypeptidase-like regulatory domain-containing protein, partial [Gemmataceae bacterium]|nr:carboxypeptidase-like regulatory domain-containing protein [Gemmataceae bacterium]